MAKRFNLLLLGTIVAGLALGAFIASLRPISAEGSRAAGQTSGGQALGQPPGAGAASAQGSAAEGAALAQGQGQTQGQGGGNAPSRALIGTVKSVDNGVLTVSAQQGDAKVTLAGGKIEKTVEGSTEDLKAGQRVTVMGQQGPDGVYTASNIQLVSAASSAVGAGGQMGQVRIQGQGQAQGQTQGQAAGQAQGQGRSQGQGQAPAGTEGPARPIAGSVAALDGDTLTITTQQGDVKVQLAGAAIQKTVEGSVEDLKAGERVMVTGQQGSEGVFAAGTIQILQAGDPTGQGTPGSTTPGR